MTEVPSQSMHALPVESQEQKQLAKRGTEVADSLSELTKITDFVGERLENDPSTSKEIGFIGEPGVGKGTLDTQIIVKLLMNPAIDGLLKAQGRELGIHTFSTKKMMLLGEKWGMPKNAEGRPSPEGINATGMIVNQLLERAEDTLPQEDLNKAHVMVYEFVGVTQHLDLGYSVVKRLAHDKNAFIVFDVSNLQTQRRSYRQRQQLHEGADRDRALRRSKTRVDLSPDELIDTMGDHVSIRRIATQMNQELLQAYRNGHIDLETVFPRRSYELFQKYPLSDFSDDQLQDFFTNLTQFSDTDMRTHELRPYLQRAYYQYLAEEVYQIPSEQYAIVEPEFQKKTVNPHPGLFKKYALDLESFFPPGKEQENVIFTSEFH